MKAIIGDQKLQVGFSSWSQTNMCQSTESNYLYVFSRWTIECTKKSWPILKW